jgi:hypothetical protein
MKTLTSHQGTGKQVHSPSETQSGTVASNGKAASPAAVSFEGLHACVTARAYELYVQRGCRDGWALEDWLEAEREIRHGAVSG